jgi:hypothetical protein
MLKTSAGISGSLKQPRIVLFAALRERCCLLAAKATIAG